MQAPFTNNRASYLVAFLLLDVPVVVFSFFVRLDHANFYGQIVYLIAMGFGGYLLGVYLEIKHQDDLLAMKDRDAGVIALLFTIVIMATACLSLFQWWWAVVASGHVHSSFWVETQAGLAYILYTGMFGSQAVWRPVSVTR